MEEVAYNIAHYSAEGEVEVQELETLENVEEVILKRYDEEDSEVLKLILPNPPGIFLICECGGLCANLKDSSISVNISEEERIKDLNSLSNSSWRKEDWRSPIGVSDVVIALTANTVTRLRISASGKKQKWSSSSNQWFLILIRRG